MSHPPCPFHRIGPINTAEGRRSKVIRSLLPLPPGHGLFGSFEMLSSWRRTREDQHVKERVAGVFQDVMLRFSGSTLIHLLTLGLAASPLTNMEAVRLFCRAASLCVAVGYVYMLSFYGSCLVFTGYLETGYRHGCFCRRVPKPDGLDSKPAWYRCLMYTRYQDEGQSQAPPPPPPPLRLSCGLRSAFSRPC